MNLKYKFSPDPATGTLTADDAKKYFSKMGFALFGFGIASSVSSFGLAHIASLLLELFGTSADALGAFGGALYSLLSIISLYSISLPVFLAMTKDIPRVKPLSANMPFGKLAAGLCVAMLLMSVGNYISNIMLTAVSAFKGSVPENPVDSMINSNSIITTIIFVVILAPILEELFFRKLLCDRLLPLGEGYAIILSSVVFGFFHGNLYQVAYGALVGALFALIYVKTGKLRYSVIYHMIINFIGAVLSPMIVEQIDLDRVNEIIESGVVDPADPVIKPVLMLLAYEFVLMAMSIAGIIFLNRASKKREAELEAGILPPPKKRRIINVFLAPGVAALIAYFSFEMVLSLI